MPLSKTEIRRCATAFVQVWPDANNEDADAKSFWDDRTNHPGSSLADLYDPLTMPVDLVKAHQALDRAVDKCYRTKPFTSEAERVGYLFERYEEYTKGLLAGASGMAKAVIKVKPTRFMR